MEPMKPMKPMEPMKPMSGGEKWWPDELGQPSSSGSQNSMRYAFFPKTRRLLIEKHGNLTTYDSGDHQISGVQQRGETSSLTFTSQNGAPAGSPASHRSGRSSLCARQKSGFPERSGQKISFQRQLPDLGVERRNHAR